MDAIEVAAKFAAYTWFRNQPENRTRSLFEAKAYAESHYHLYYKVAYANRGWGRLLVDVIDARASEVAASKRTRTASQTSVPELCGVH